MGVRMNFDGVEPQAGGGSGPLPDGEYIVRITAAAERTASTGTPGFEFEMEVLVGEFEGRKVWDRLWFTPRTAGQVRWKMECAGIPIPVGEVTVEPEHFEGRRVLVVVRQEQYTANDGNEKTRAAVQGWQPAPGSGTASDDPFSGGAGAPSPKPAGADDDDIPFAPSYI